MALKASGGDTIGGNSGIHGVILDKCKPVRIIADGFRQASRSKNCPRDLAQNGHAIEPIIGVGHFIVNPMIAEALHGFAENS